MNLLSNNFTGYQLDGAFGSFLLFLLFWDSLFYIAQPHGPVIFSSNCRLFKCFEILKNLFGFLMSNFTS